MSVTQTLEFSPIQTETAPPIERSQEWRVIADRDPNGHPDTFVTVRGNDDVIQLEALPEVLDTFAPASGEQPARHSAALTRMLGSLAHLDLSQEPTTLHKEADVPLLWAVFEDKGRLAAAKLWRLDKTAEGETVVEVIGQDERIASVPEGSPVEIFGERPRDYSKLAKLSLRSMHRTQNR